VIFFLAPAERHHMRDSLRSFLDGPGRALLSRLEIMTYEDAYGAPARPGTYIFAGTTNLGPVGRERAAETWLRLTRLGSEVRLLNDPLATLGRYELLGALYANGTNAFRVRRLLETEVPLRFPVFIRHATRHDGSLTRLLRNERELQAAADMLQAFEDANDLLVVEFCNTSDEEGVFRKYGAVLVGDRVVPRSLLASRNWAVKNADLVDERHVREEHDFLEANPHEDWVRDVFRLAGVEYGRIDYAFLDGRPQVWEINTNPALWLPPRTPSRIAYQQQVARRLLAAFEELDREAVAANRGV
jgi:hypothetical protein